MHWARRSGTEPLWFVKQLVKYLEVDYTANPIHPQHKDENEKQIARLRRKLRRLKSPAAKRKVLAEIKKLQPR